VGRGLLQRLHTDELREVVAIRHAELEARAVDVTFDGADRQRQRLGDLLVGQSGGDESGDLPLAVRQR